MKSFLVISLFTVLLVSIACSSSSEPVPDEAETVVPTSHPTATKATVPARAPTLEPTATKTDTSTSGQIVEPTPTQTPIPNTIAEAATRVNPGVAIIKRGDLGGQAKEKGTVQLAIETMMVSNLMTSVTPNDSPDYIRAEGNAATDTDFGGGQTLVGSTRTTVTAYCYTWDSNGTILSQLEPGTPPCGATP